MSKNKSCETVCKKTSIGGQALLGGIMMRGPKISAMAVRNPRKEIVIEEWETNQKPVPKLFKLPVFRGMYNMVASFSIGMKCIMRSAEISELDVEDENKENIEENSGGEQINIDSAAENEKAEGASADALKEEKKAAKKDKREKEKKSDDKISKSELTIASVLGVVLGLLLSIGLFLYLPTQLFTLVVNNLIGYENDGSYLYMVVRSGFEGIIRILIFVGYMFAVSFMKDIRMTFMYHGAEHKTIFCYEKGLPLTVENIRKQSRLHPRCGTSFMVIMLLLGIIIGMFIPEFNVSFYSIVNNLVRSAVKLLLLPLTVGLGYEVIKFAGRHDNWFVRFISAPGKLMQLISTKEPTDDMIECAIAAMEKVIPEDESDKW